MPLDIEIFNQGIYSPRQAAHLIGGTPQEIRRWTRGSGPNAPLWAAHYQTMDDTAELNFADLIELRVVKAFRKSGISLQAIRYAIEFAKVLSNSAHPLSTLEFKTDGREILMSALEQDGSLVSLSRDRAGQKVFAEIVKQSLSDLEYEDDIAIRWRPTSAKHVVIDPTRSFGAPIVDSYGISTKTLYDEFLLFSDKKYLAKIYEIPIKIVNDAIKFEEFLNKQSARENG